MTEFKFLGELTLYRITNSGCRPRQRLEPEARLELQDKPHCCSAQRENNRNTGGGGMLLIEAREDD